MLKKISLAPIIAGLALTSLIPGYAVSNIYLVIIGLFGIYCIFRNKKYTFSGFQLPIMLFYLYEVCTLFWTLDKKGTEHQLELHLPLLILPIFIAQYPKFSIKDQYNVIRIFSVSLIIYFVACLYQAYVIYSQVDKDIELFFYHELVSLFDNHAIYISLFSSFCILNLFNLQRPKILDCLLILILTVFLLLLASKNIIISTLFIQFILFMLAKNNIWLKVGGILFILAISIVFFKVDTPVKERFLEEFKGVNFNQILYGTEYDGNYWTGTTLRIFQLRLGIDIFKDYMHYWQGIGIGAAQDILDGYYKHYGVENYKSYNFHNQYMETLVEGGFIGLLFLLSMLFYSFYYAIKNRSIPMLIFTFFMFFLFFTEVIFSRQKGVLFYALVYCFFMNANNKEKLKIK